MLFNTKRALNYMEEYQLDVLVATTPVNIRYFTDYYSWLDPIMKKYMTEPGESSNLTQQYAVFPREGEPALVVSPMFAINASDLWVKELHTFGNAGLDESVPPLATNNLVRSFMDKLHDGHQHASATDALLHILRNKGLLQARIGLEKDDLPSEIEYDLGQALGGALIKDCSNLIRLVRTVKSQEELARLIRAAEISEIAGMESLKKAQVGSSMSELANNYRTRIAAQGADFDHFAYSIKGLGIATEPDLVLNADDVLYTDFGCIYRGYFSDTGTTLALCELPDPLIGRFEALRACVDAGEETIHPGAKASSVRNAMWDVFSSYGYSACFPHGHGLGLEVRDYPIIVKDNGLHIRDDCVDVPSDLPLEEDMVINLEAGMFLPGTGSLQIEQTYVVTTAGCRSLVPQQRTEPLRSSH